MDTMRSPRLVCAFYLQIKKRSTPPNFSFIAKRLWRNQRACAFKFIYFKKNFGRLITFLSRFTFAFTAKYLKCAAGGIPQIKNPAAQSGKRGIFRFFVF